MQALLKAEATAPGTIDKVILIQQIQDQLRRGQRLPADLLSWYTATLHRWRGSLRSPRPLSDIPPTDRPRILHLLNIR